MVARRATGPRFLMAVWGAYAAAAPDDAVAVAVLEVVLVAVLWDIFLDSQGCI